MLRSAFYLLFPLGLLGCAQKAYQSTALASWHSMRAGEFDSALVAYEDKVKRSQDYLLKLMDTAILLREAERFDESNQRLLEAANILEQAGYLSADEEAISLVSNEEQKTYQGEDFEKILVHVYLALNFIQLRQWDSALVEARRVNEILYQMIFEGKRPYNQNAFAQYLSGLLFEQDAEWNSAWIDFKKTRDLVGAGKEPRFLKLDLLRSARALGFQEELQKLSEDFGGALAEQAVQSLERRDAQLVLVFEAGKSPQKKSTKETHRKRNKQGGLVEVLVPVPVYTQRPSTVYAADLVVGQQVYPSAVLNNIGLVARQHLESRMQRVIAKALASAAVKAGIAVGVGKATDSTELGVLAGLALFAMAEADTRSWLLLPESLQIAKAFLPAGEYSDVFVRLKDRFGNEIERVAVDELQLRKSEIHFIQIRSLY